MTQITDAQFIALAQLVRLRGGPSQEVAKLVMVNGMTVPDAAKTTGLDLRLAHRSVKNATANLLLAQSAAGVRDFIPKTSKAK